MGIGNLYDPINLETLAHPEPVSARALALQARRELPRRRGRQGPHHRRVHRPRARRAALERRPAPGGRGEGERAHPGRDAHDGDDHLPEPLPPLQEALGDDRAPPTPRPTEFHETYKLGVVVDPHQQAHDPRGSPGRRLQDGAREVHGGRSPRSSSATRRASPCSSARRASRRATRSRTLLKKKKIPHAVLNAKHHEREAFVVAQAGRKGAITVSTNMAGRGTDIVLGGNPEMIAKLEFREHGRDADKEPEAFAEVVEKYDEACKAEGEEVRKLGGLHILGTERHESRRIDNQLRGRAGRQGDPGSSRFYLSLEDDLMRIFAGDRVKSLMERMGMPDNEPIEHPWVTQEHPGRAAQGRGAQLRHPQAPARIRRRDERAAQDRLQAAPAAARSASTSPRRSTTTASPPARCARSRSTRASPTR